MLQNNTEYEWSMNFQNNYNKSLIGKKEGLEET